MKTVMTILGTRPEIIRLSRIIPLLDKHCNHILVNTMQNSDFNMNEVFFNELELRTPNIYLYSDDIFLGRRIGKMLGDIEELFEVHQPDAVLILGDTNSGLCAIMAERKGIPVYHMEAGNRCFDRKVPEEVNRKIIDSISTYNLPYTPGSRENLIREGVDKRKIFTSGNPIAEVLSSVHCRVMTEDSKILQSLQLKPSEYFLATFHRAETVDIPNRLEELVHGLGEVAEHYGLPVVCSVHPRTRSRLEASSTNFHPLIMFLEPFGFFDFLNLERNARCILTDSGTVSEEACLFSVPCVIVRDVTERPELVRCGSAMLSGIDSENILSCTQIMDGRKEWSIPEGYGCENVSHKVVQFILGGGE